MTNTNNAYLITTILVGYFVQSVEIVSCENCSMRKYLSKVASFPKRTARDEKFGLNAVQWHGRTSSKVTCTYTALHPGIGWQWKRGAEELESQYFRTMDF